MRAANLCPWVALLFACNHDVAAFESLAFPRAARTVLQNPVFRPVRLRRLASGVSLAMRSLDVNRKSSASDNNDTEGRNEGAREILFVAPTPGGKLRQLKDMMWVREALEDLTAAEFACTVEAEGTDDNEEDANRRSKRKRKRAVDYEKLLTQLNMRIRDLGCENMVLTSGIADFVCDLETGEGTGMGSLTYNDKQRTALLERLLRTRRQLIDIIQGNDIDMDIDKDNAPFLQMPDLPELPRIELPKEEVDDSQSSGPKLYVRDDGTVDWDGALQDQAALRKFGTAVWARINGRESETIDEESTKSAENASARVVTAKVIDTPEIKQARAQLEKFRSQLVTMEQEHYKLLNSAIAQGQATANVKLAALAPKLRNQIQESAAALENMKIMVSFQTLIYEMARIYAYLVGELGNPALNGYVPLQDRLNVAEFGLLESQVDSFHLQFRDAETVDEDVLAVVFEQLTDFKRRLGIDYYVTGLSFDREAISSWLSELLVKTKNGLAFYVKGIRLLWNDFVFCLRLINRAAQGYTLKPREVRTMRRTFKDIITFIPFVIILLIPLSPVGHVLVFGAIQRFFPDFFPTCFTEQRQNLLQLYETAEYSELTINETWTEKLSRLSEAFVYVAANAFRTLYFQLLGLRRGDSSDESSDKKQ